MPKRCHDDARQFVHGQLFQLRALNRRQEDFVLPNDRTGLAVAGKLNIPGDVFRVRPFQRQSAGFGVAVARAAKPLPDIVFAFTADAEPRR